MSEYIVNVFNTVGPYIMDHNHEHDHDHHHGTSDNIYASKVAAIFALFVIFTVSAFIPYLLRKMSHFKIILQLLTALSAGAMMAIGVLHILPEANMVYNEYRGEGHDHHTHTVQGDMKTLAGGHSHPFAWMEFTMIVTLFALVSAEHLLQYYFGGSQGHCHGNFEHLDRTNDHHHHHHEHKDVKSVDGEDNSGDSATKQLEEGTAVQMADLALEHKDGAAASANTNKDSSAVTTGAGSDGHIIVDPSIESADALRIARIDAIICTVAMALHGVFNGLALGADVSQGSAYWTLYGITLGHKFIDGIATGVPIFRARFHILISSLCIAVCAFSNSLGIIIGYHVSGASDASLGKAIVFGMSAGSFLFVALFEMLPASLHSKELLWAKVLLIFVGIGLVTIIMSV